MQLSKINTQINVKNVTLLTAIVICILTPKANGLLQCYTCTHVAGDGNDLCLKDPAAMNHSITICDKTYCTIVRQQIKKNFEVVSFQRTCVDKPQHFNEMIEDSTYKFFYRSCKEDLCNDGDGLSSKDPGASPNVIIPGKSSAVILKYSSLVLLSICLCFENIIV